MLGSNFGKTLLSNLDASVNWIIPHGKSNLEARYVRRNQKKVSGYLSSHNGCTMGCKMCFLTQLGQTNFKHSDLNHYQIQLNKILEYYDTQPKAERINLNFMARGEPLANKQIILNYPELFESFRKKTEDERNLKMKINISTIMPKIIENRNLNDIFRGLPVYLYYSLYSRNTNFKKQWMPNAMDYYLALEKLKEFQLENPHLPITLHWTLIQGVNDDYQEVKQLRDEIAKFAIRGKFNLVKYNNPPNLNYHETDPKKAKELFGILKTALIDPEEKSKIIPRVGKDVYASCGMFIRD